MVKCKFRGGELVSTYIDPKLEIQVTYGYIKRYDRSNMKCIVESSIFSYDITLDQLLLMNNQAVSADKMDNYIESPIQIFLNGEAFLEAKIIPDG